MQLPQIYPVTCHTDHVGPGSTFVAVKGMKQNGTDFVPLALQKGANKIVIEASETIDQELNALIKFYDAALIRVVDARRALAELSAQALNFPARKLKIIGITGTKGKTTTTYLLEHILRFAGFNTARISTVKNSILGIELDTNLTTPHPDYLHIFFDQCVKENVEYVVMEVAAQAISLDRVYGLEFDGIIFTNFGQEHGEFYPTIEQYFAAKVALLNQNKPNGFILINSDDLWLQKITAPALTFGFTNAADFKASHNKVASGISLTINKTIINCPNLFGPFNAYNILAASVMANKIGITWDTIAQAVNQFTCVPGRLEYYALRNGARCFIDYAHNPSSFKALFSALRSMTDNLIVVFGAGGDRDKTKRPIMGKIAAEWCDLIILTSDNPRSEDPQDIINDILIGIADNTKKKILCQLDREQAIKVAYENSHNSSIIALLGKGPDEYQLIKNNKFYFSEREIIHTL